MASGLLRGFAIGFEVFCSRGCLRVSRLASQRIRFSSTTTTMTSNPSEKCPVDHSSINSCPVDHGKAVETTEACPVDHSSRSTWTNLFGTNTTASSSTAPPSLPVDREVSSIPRNDSENWVYPSQAQFFAAMARKKHNPRESDMKVIVPIHNAVNERAWGEVMKWEQGQGGESCGGVKLVSFKGRPGDRTPKARLNMLLGYVRVYLFSFTKIYCDFIRQLSSTL